MSFSQRLINFRFELGAGDFGEPGVDTVELTGMRASVDIAHAGGNSLSLAEIRIWGMPLEIMNRLTVLNVLAYPERRNNRITISAGDEDAGVNVCFVGGIQEAWVDASDPPGFAFHVSAASAFVEVIQSIPPTSFRGSVDVALLLGGLAAQMGFALENGGVTGKIDNPYLPGSIGSQIESVCRAAGIQRFIDPIKRVLAIWPKGQSRDAATALVSSETGLVGYPSFTQNGVRLKSIYNPNLIYGTKLEVRSELTPACGTWVIANVTHSLDANVPGGQWFTEVECTLFGHSAPIPSR